MWLKTRSSIGFEPNLAPLSLLLEPKHDDNPIHQLAVHCKRPVLPLHYGLGGCAIERWNALNDFHFLHRTVVVEGDIHRYLAVNVLAGSLRRQNRKPLCLQLWLRLEQRRNGERHSI